MLSFPPSIVFRARICTLFALSLPPVFSSFLHTTVFFFQQCHSVHRDTLSIAACKPGFECARLVCMCGGVDRNWFVFEMEKFLTEKRDNQRGVATGVHCFFVVAGACFLVEAALGAGVAAAFTADFDTAPPFACFFAGLAGVAAGEAGGAAADFAFLADGAGEAGAA
jgi:hypothetical protein